jgi:Ran GTPase-activating protein (RanGAP) involved in mRNA processing and transport
MLDVSQDRGVVEQLAAEPDVRLLQALLDRLDGWPKAELPTAIACARAALSRLPHRRSLRRDRDGLPSDVVVPRAWVERLLAGYDDPRLGLGRILRFEDARVPDRIGERVAASQHLGGLEGLWLERCALGDGGLWALAAASERLPRLRWLELPHNELGPGGVAALEAVGDRRPLESLSLSANPLGEAVGPVLARAGWLARLCRLDLRQVELDDRAAVRLARAPAMATLSTLVLTDNAIGRRGLTALAWALADHRLSALHLAHNQIDGLSALVQARLPEQLRVLDLSGNPLGVEAARLGRCGPLPELRRLSLRHCAIGTAGLFAVASLRAPALRELDLSGNGLDDECAAVLAASPLLESVRQLVLTGNGISEVGAMALACSPHARRLQELDLDHNAMDYQAMLRVYQARRRAQTIARA